MGVPRGISLPLNTAGVPVMVQEIRGNWGHQDKVLLGCWELTEGPDESLQKAWLGLGQSLLRGDSAKLG